MNFQLEQIEASCAGLGLKANFSGNSLSLELEPGVILVFSNEKDDCSAGFSGTPWHFHDSLIACCDGNAYIEIEAIDIPLAIVTGELLVVTQINEGKIRDRWLMPKADSLELRHLEAGEQLIVQRVSTGNVT